MCTLSIASFGKGGNHCGVIVTDLFRVCSKGGAEQEKGVKQTLKGDHSPAAGNT